MTAPSLIDAARIAVGELLMSMGEPYCYSALKASQCQRAFLAALPPDAVIVSRALLIEAAQALLCTGMFGDIAVTLHVAASGEGKA